MVRQLATTTLFQRSQLEAAADEVLDEEGFNWCWGNQEEVSEKEVEREPETPGLPRLGIGLHPVTLDVQERRRLGVLTNTHPLYFSFFRQFTVFATSLWAVTAPAAAAGEEERNGVVVQQSAQEGV